MNLNYNDVEQNKEKGEYVTKKTFVITVTILAVALIIATASLLLYFNDKLQRTVESLELKDDLTLIQNSENDWTNGITVE